MTEQRHSVDSITSDQLDTLYDERDRYFHFACAARGASGAPSFPDLTDTILALVDRAEQAEAARDEAIVRAEYAEAVIESVRKIHERRDNGAGPYCYLCADSGDMDWPCTTIRALDQQQPTADRHADVQGRCPACAGTGLFLGSGGHVTCPRLDCPNPTAAADMLNQPQRPTTGLPPEQPCTDPRHTGPIREQLGCVDPAPAEQQP